MPGDGAESTATPLIGRRGARLRWSPRSRPLTAGLRGRQAQLARLLTGVKIVAISDGLGRRCGELRGHARTSDPIDAAVALIGIHFMRK